MTKKLNWIVLVLLCATFVFCDDKSDKKIKTDYEKLKLNGKVKSITETYYLPVISDDTIKQGEQTNGAPSFFESEEEVFISYESILYFNHDGNIAECTLSDSASDFYLRETFDYQDNLLTSKVGTLSNEFFYKQIFKYDLENRECLREFYDEEEHLFESVTIDYVGVNNVVEKVVSDHGKTSFERKIVMKNGLPVSSSRMSNSVQIERWTGDYDKNGRIVLSELFDNKNNTTQIIKYEYDDFGNETKCSVFSPEEELVTEYVYMYKYDKFNNWIQRASITDYAPDLITVRDIEYYK